MGIAHMQKITITAHKSLEEELTDLLYRLGTLHVEKVSEEEVRPKTLTEEEVLTAREYTFRISEIDFIQEFLREQGILKESFFRTLVKEKYLMTTDEFCNASSRLEIKRIYDECVDLESKIIKAQERLSDLRAERDMLSRWKSLDIPLNQLAAGPRTELLIGFLLKVDVEKTLEDLEEQVPDSSLEIIGYYEERAQVLVFYLRDMRDTVHSIFREHDFEEVVLGDIPQTPIERVKDLSLEIDSVDEEKSELSASGEKYKKYAPDLVILKAYYENERKKIDITSDFGLTKSTVRIEGWMPSVQVDKDVVDIRERFSDLHVEISEPAEDENPPVLLENRRWARPFEVLTKLYGVPNNKEYDPTFLIAISFAVFFGFCIGDVGYGLVLIIVFSLLKRYLPLGESVKDLFTVMTWGGAFAMAIGVITGSWFGIDPANLPSFLQSLIVFDSLKDPIPIMGVCMGLGVIHMLAGTVVEFRDNWKLRKIADALIDQGLILFLFIGTIISAILYIAGLIPISVIYIVVGTAFGGMIILLGHSAKSIPGKIFGGLYETYNTLVGWLGDTVSYVRLFALGLATFAVGWVINILAGMVKGIAPVIGILFMLIVLVIGHTFNIVVNLLGAFVHPLRLEFVEFFGKFYENGGQPFKPFRIESNRVLIKK